VRAYFFTWRYAIRRFVGVGRTLTDAGHELVVAIPRDRKQKLRTWLRRGATIEAYDEVSDAAFGEALALLRQTRDYAWYLSPEQQVASFNRRRALANLMQTASAGAIHASPDWPDPAIPVEADQVAALDAVLGALDEWIPPDRGVRSLLEGQRPDVVLVSPLVRQQTHQTEVVKAARALDIPSALLVYSWDNLSNKGRIHVAPDRILAWNELQRREAEELHGVDPERVVVTGAPHWDRFFALEPSIDREELCIRHGFDADQPIVLYLGSTNEVCPDEPPIVETWLDALRGSSGPLRRANILIRPHPREVEIWQGWDPAQERVAVTESTKRKRQSLFDQLHHSAAAVGLNTSAQIEASIVGRPVYTFSAGAAAPAQSGSLHFYYLLKDRGGVVSYAETLGEHVAQLEHGVAGDYDRDAIRRFCEFFVRPRGLDRAVSPIVAEEVLKLAGSSAQRPPVPATTPSA
jgi:hypothetical protein